MYLVLSVRILFRLQSFQLYWLGQLRLYLDPHRFKICREYLDVVLTNSFG
ncbi:MAG: hypothetical protein SGJ20_14150 [Planctomycetota bacterium]|nr:hypothetical protein [Planctomycetota bacterium]